LLLIVFSSDHVKELRQLPALIRETSAALLHLDCNESTA